MDHGKTFLFRKVEWSGDGQEWILFDSFSSRSSKGDVLNFKLRGSDRSIRSGVYLSWANTLHLYIDDPLSRVWVRTKSNSRHGTVVWDVESGPSIRWTGVHATHWIATNWGALVVKYGALVTIVVGIGIKLGVDVARNAWAGANPGVQTPVSDSPVSDSPVSDSPVSASPVPVPSAQTSPVPVPSAPTSLVAASSSRAAPALAMIAALAAYINPSPRPPAEIRNTGMGEQAHFANACTAYANMYACYHDEFLPPKWVLNECPELLSKFGESAVALYPEGVSIDVVKRLLTQREPTNINAQKRYNHNELGRLFGYTEGAYVELSEDGQKLPPQVAVACSTPIVQYPGASPSEKDGPPRVALGEHKVVHVVSIIGLAFDDPGQPDMNYFYDKKGNLKLTLLKQAMLQAYLLAFAATEAMGKSILVPSPIGDMAFRPKKEYPASKDGQDRFIEEIVKPAIKEASTFFPHIRVEPLTRYLSNDESDINTFTVPWCFFTPNGNYNTAKKEIQDRVFVNAWDCWSMLGNGNFGDPSADGYWGRSTALSLLGWPLSNPKMRYVPCKVAPF